MQNSLDNVTCQLRVVSIVSGAGYGLRFPFSIIECQWPLPLLTTTERLHTLLQAHFSHEYQTPFSRVIEVSEKSEEKDGFIALILYWHRWVAYVVGLPILEMGKTLSEWAPRGKNIEGVLLLPYVATPYFEVSVFVLEWLLGVALDCIYQTDLDITQRVLDLQNKLRPFSIEGGNTLRILYAAVEKNIPCRWLVGANYQFAWGKYARWTESSFTDVTSVIAVNFARNKTWAAHVLRQAGLPVPEHEVVKNVEAALKCAAKLGYPVVVKPPALDGGVGVAAGLENERAVEIAFHEAKKFSEEVLIEKHIVGEDYRLTVWNGKLVWAIHRQPGGVVGDGQHTIRALLEKINADPRRGDHARFALTRLVVDKEAEDLLNEAGVYLESVPDQGKFIALRRKANVNTGGYPMPCLEKVHPDNRRLVERAAQALKLDIAGVDFIIPDISVSWRKNGGAICEVNAQPAFVAASQQHLYGDFLSMVVPGTGRIPVIVIVGDTLADLLAKNLSALLQTQGMFVGRVGLQAAFVNEEEIGMVSFNSFLASQMLLAMKTVKILVVVVSTPDILQTGIAFDRYDIFIFAQTPALMAPEQLASAMLLLLSNNQGKVVVNIDDVNGLILVDRIGGAQMIMTSLSSEWSEAQPPHAVLIVREEENKIVYCLRSEGKEACLTSFLFSDEPKEERYATALCLAAGVFLGVSHVHMAQYFEKSQTQEEPASL